jgi:hypothetical protein
VAFGKNSFAGNNSGFNGKLSKGFDSPIDNTKINFDQLDTPFTFTPNDSRFKSRIKFYDRDSLWARWRRGYELYTITQSLYGSGAAKRSTIGDYRFNCAFQHKSGIFTTARVFTFPSNTSENGEQLVAVRDANVFNFYDFGLPILSTVYLGAASTAAYSQSGTDIVVLYPNHNLQPSEQVRLTFLSGSAVTATLPIVSRTTDSFTCTAATPLTTVGNVSVALSTSFEDVRWTETRVKIRKLPAFIDTVVGERFTDRITETDPGVLVTYAQSGYSVSVTCATEHGLVTGKKINFSTTTGDAVAGLFLVRVTSPTTFDITSSIELTTTGTGLVYRLIKKYDYSDYVGYTVKSIDRGTNEIVFQRQDSYGAVTDDNQKVSITVPAQRGFALSRFLTSEIRYQCACQDFTRRQTYNLYDEKTSSRFPKTPITSVKPGSILYKDDSVADRRDNDGIFSDFGYISTSNFNTLSTYRDQKETCYTELMYYQMRWCKHIYAALFSLVHDEGNQKIDIFGTYTQTGDTTVTITSVDHGLNSGIKIAVEFEDNTALSGYYTVNSVIGKDTFTMVYPYVQTVSGRCIVNNIKIHEYIKDWLLEPSDHPVGDKSDAFYDNFEKQSSALKQSLEKSVMLKMGKPWIGSLVTLNDNSLPQQTPNYDESLISSILTDHVLRDEAGNLSPTGTQVNYTETMIAIVSKVLNLSPSYIESGMFGYINQPAINFPPNYQAKTISAGSYSATTPTVFSEIIDCSTYSPYVLQDVIIDCGQYTVAP